MTKSQDALLFQFYQKNYKLRITDLHQGIIWGTQTKETMLHEDLINRFDYDSDYGTVLNRFIVQAAINTPLTIYGTGEQTRAFIHIENSMDCIGLAIQKETQENRVKIYNQITETHKLIDLVNLIGKPYEFLDNPRNELKTNELLVKNDQFLKLGLKPIRLNKEAIQEIYSFVLKYKDRIDKTVIYPSSSWK
jgi:UDP-sulfoquinovose synthase